MKQSLLIASLAIAATYSLTVMAGSDVQSLKDKLAKESSPENVKAVAIQQKKMSCLQNAKNKKLQNEQKEDYMSVCMNKNEAQLAFSSVNYQRFASVESVNK